MKLDQTTCLVVMYVGPLTSGKRLDETRSTLYRDNQSRIITTGDLNARHRTWNKVNNQREKTLVKLAS